MTDYYHETVEVKVYEPAGGPPFKAGGAATALAGDAVAGTQISRLAHITHLKSSHHITSILATFFSSSVGTFEEREEF